MYVCRNSKLLSNVFFYMLNGYSSVLLSFRLLSISYFIVRIICFINKLQDAFGYFTSYQSFSLVWIFNEFILEVLIFLLLIIVSWKYNLILILWLAKYSRQ